MPDAPTPDTPTPAMATASQLQALERLGIEYTPPLTKREASQKIEEATQELDAKRQQAACAKAQSEVTMRRAAFESVRLNREIDESGLHAEVDAEMIRLRQAGQSSKRKNGRGR